jgi:glycosyltransferase involved in cell wall biosynthesis
MFDVEEHMFMAQTLYPSVKRITLHKKPGLDISVFFKIHKLIHNNNYDSVNTHLRALFYSTPAIVMNKTNYFHTVHNMAAKETGTVSRFIHRLLFRYFGVTPIGISREVLSSIQEEYGGGHIVLIDNGVKHPEATTNIANIQNEINNYKKTSDSKVFLTIGRIEHQKNHMMLVEVFNRLISEGDDVILLIIGDDPYPEKPLLNKLKNIASSGIHFLGMKQNVSDYLLCSDAFCLSSLYEGLPITLLEAMSLGVIPICTPAGGIPDVLQDMENGLLSTDLSGESYYAKIKQFLSLSTETKTSLSIKTIHDFENAYDITKTAQKYIELYKKEYHDQIYKI